MADPTRELIVCPASTEEVIDKILQFMEIFSETKLYAYQHVFLYRTVEMIILNEGGDVTGLWSRQCGKCLAKGTPVMMYDGSIKKAEDVVEGDRLMGDDSTPRNVLSLARGRERMVRVAPTSNCHEPYVVNESHILSILRRKSGSGLVDWVKEDLPVSQLLEEGDLARCRGYTAAVDFPSKKVPIDPYYLGVWLGGGPNGMLDTLHERNLLHNERIPDDYLANSRHVRAQLLAGMIDSGVHRSPEQNVCKLVQRRKSLAVSVQRLARSLGLRASLAANGSSWWVTLYGALWDIPTKIKKYGRVALRDDPLAYGFNLERLPEDDYYGFTIDGNKKFLLGDFTVTHNTESVAILCVGLAIMLPALAKAFPDDTRFLPYAQGFNVGIYAPVDKQAKISYQRMRRMILSKHGQSVLRDPDIGISIDTNRADLLTLSNGSKILARTASEESQTEGETHDLIVLEEAQKLSKAKVEKELSPMLAARNGSMVKIGTAWHSRGGFHQSIQRNVNNRKKGGKRNHFQFPYDVVIEEKRRMYEWEIKETGVGNPFHLFYEKFVESEKRKMGGTASDEFKMNYMCLWQESRVIAVNIVTFKKAAITDLEAGQSLMGYQVGGLDVAKVTDSTVLTTMLVDRERPIVNTIALPGADEDKQLYYNKVITGWYEMGGAFEGASGQYARLVSYIEQTGIRILVVDATAIGNPVYERIQVLLEGRVICVPYVYNIVTKHNLYKYYLQELHAGRVRYAAGPSTQETQDYQLFVKQHEGLDKILKGQYVVCEAPPGDHDDYPDSAALACWGEKIADEVMIPELLVTTGISDPTGHRQHGPTGGRAGRYARRW